MGFKDGEERGCGVQEGWKGDGLWGSKMVRKGWRGGAVGFKKGGGGGGGGGFKKGGGGGGICGHRVQIW